MTDTPQSRQWIRTLFNADQGTETPEATAPAGTIAGPVIPGQEKTPASVPRNATHGFLADLFN